MDYLPWFEDVDGRKWEVLSLDFCVDWGGRQCQIEAQTREGDKYPTKTFVIYPLNSVFTQWSGDEFASAEPVHGLFYEHILQMFKVFDVKE